MRDSILEFWMLCNSRKVWDTHCWAGGGCAAGEAVLEEAAAFPVCVPVCLQLSERLRLTEIGVMVHTIPQ